MTRRIGFLGEAARLSEAPSDGLATTTFARELQAAGWLWDALGLADMAHVHELTTAGVLDPAIGRQLLADLLAFHDDTPVEAVTLDPAVGDTYNNRDRMLHERFGDRMGHVHTGRARREATTLAWHLVTRSMLLDSIRATTELLDALLDVADEHRITVLPDTTYLQHAQPTSLAHWLLGHAHPVARDLDRLAASLALVNRSPAGSGSVNGSRFPLDRARMADLLGFDAPIVHTRDAMWAPDLALSTMSSVLAAMTPIDRLVEELQLWATSEYGFVSLADRHARTSVIMPQKKNPYSLAMIRGHAREVVGDLVAVATTNLTPSGQPDNRTASYDRVPTALRWHAGSARLLADVLRGADFHADRMRTEALTGFATSTDVCDWLVETTDLDNRTVHRTVGRAVRAAIDDGRDQLAAADLHTAAEELGADLPDVDPAELDRLGDPEHLLSLRTQLGGAATVPTMLADLRTTARRATVPDDHPLATFDGRFLATIADAAGVGWSSPNDEQDA
ncbi:argininosuccinate lyase [Salsipaludibacter albus]|uniref:argininosuccinate lyase n=1 Tax=Salsipaludibacter albus TaxID=2849650 RepID=UPI001EE41959|nr:lyase family protein [Salsipaludibacter albus]MBY5161954.1 argininosuccinate lyase [Salsipaludibacter albus]